MGKTPLELAFMKRSPSVDSNAAQSQSIDLDIAAEVSHSIGWPRLADTYRVEFRVPDGKSSGVKTIQLSAAWIAGGRLRPAQDLGFARVKHRQKPMPSPAGTLVAVGRIGSDLRPSECRS
jgi:hypothetical protein